MTNNHIPSFSLEKRMLKIRIFWYGLLLGLFVVFTALFILSFLNSSPGVPPTTSSNNNTVLIHSQTINTNNNQSLSSFNLLNSLNILYIIALVTSVLIVQTGKKIQSKIIINDFFKSIGVIKIQKLNGIVTLDKNYLIVINWSDKGFFIIKHDEKEITFAKSSELYWKLLYLKRKLLKNEIS